MAKVGETARQASAPRSVVAPHRPTLRAIEVMESLAGRPSGRTLTELSQDISVPKSTLVPILRTLRLRRHVSLDEGTGRYRVGVMALVVGSTFAAGAPLVPLLQEEMRQAVDECSETCQLAVLDGDCALYLAKVDSPEPIRMISSVGTRIPAYRTALGKALLSDMGADEVRELFPGPLERVAPNTLASVDDLLANMEACRARGVFRESEESTAGIACYALPLRREGRVVAALSVTVPLFRLDAARERSVCEALAAARERAERVLARYPGEGIC